LISSGVLIRTALKARIIFGASRRRSGRDFRGMNVRDTRQLGLASAALFCGVAFACEARGDTAAALPIATQIDEIVVTATKREMTLQRVPLAVTAISGAALEALGARDFEDYFRRVPGLAVLDNGAGRKRYLLRGVSTIASNLSQATVAQYMDEVPLTDNFDQQPDPRLIDIERVEVLRGPQGTLFGARAVAGTIRTITRKPVMDEVAGSAAVTLSGTKHGGFNQNIEGVINTPLGGNVALRAAAFYAHDEGYVDNVFAGGTFRATPANLPPGTPIPPPYVVAPINEENFSDVTFFGGRAALRWQPSDRLTVDLMGLAQKGIIEGAPFYDVTLTGDESAGLINAVIGDSGNTDNLYIGTATANYDLDWANLTAVASYANRNNAQSAGTNAFMGLTGGQGPGSTIASGADTKSWTFETRLASTHEGPIAWLLGAYGFVQNRDGQQKQTFGFGTNLTQQHVLFHSHTNEFAGFGEVSYAPIAPLKFTVGARYSNYRNRLDNFFVVAPPGGMVGADPTPPRFAEDSTTLKFEIDYTVSDDILLYTLASQGFRPGGFNPNASPGFNVVPEEFESDTLWNYELGAKTAFFDRRLTVNGALYRIDWTRMQVQSFAPSPNGPMPMQFTTNFSSSRIVGLELEASARVSENLSVDASFNHFFKASLTEDVLPQPTGLTPRAGDPLSYNPETSFLLGGEYRYPLGEWMGGRVTGSFRVDWTHTGRRFTGFRRTLASGAPNTIYNNLRPYDLVNVRLGINAQRWRAQIFIDNIADARPIMQQQNFAPVTTRVSSRPRTFGMTVSRNF
jgi:iron complex outermembrane receptor protein